MDLTAFVTSRAILDRKDRKKTTQEKDVDMVDVSQLICC